MTRWLAFAALALAAGCGPHFEGDARKLAFTSSMAREFRSWTPASPVALGTEASFAVYEPPCVLSCSAPRREDATVENEPDGGSLTITSRAPDGGAWISVRAAEVGQAKLHWRGALSDDFSVRVAAASDVGLSDPILLNQPIAPEFIGFDGGTWPDVGDAVVIGPDAQLFLEVLVLDDAGTPLGFDSNALQASISPADAGWSVSLKGTLLDLHTPDAGTASLSLSWRDGGVARTFPVRVAAAEEAASVSLLQQSLGGQANTYIFKAVVTTAAGETFFEPPLEWTTDAEWVERSVENLGQAIKFRPRRDVHLYDFVPPGSGTFQPVVKASLGGHTGSASVPFVLIPEGFEETGRVARPCGCTQTGATFSLLSLLAALAARRRR